MEGWPGRLHSGILYTAMLEAANWTVFGIAGRIGVPVRTSALNLKRWVPTGTRLRIVGRSKTTDPKGVSVALEAVTSDGLPLQASTGVSSWRTCESVFTTRDPRE